MFFLPLRKNAQERDGFPIYGGGWPLLAHMPAMAKDALGLYRKAEQALGQFFWLDMGFGNMQLMVTHPEIVNALRNRTTTSTHMAETSADFLGRSLLVHDGAIHARMRGAMNGPFTPKGLSGTELGPMMADVIEERISHWNEGQDLTILFECRELTLNVLFRMIGAPVEELAEWRHQYSEFMLSLLPPKLKFPGFPAWRAARAKAWLDVKLKALVADVRANPKPNTLLTQIVMGKDENGEGLGETEMLDNLRLLVLAGHETTASTMAWMTVVLGRNPEMWDRLVAEAVNSAGVPRTPKDLKNFPVAEAVFREALRLHPPAIVDGRRVSGEFKVDGRTIPVGTDVLIPIMLMSRNPELYPNPDAFDIDRWINKKESVTPMELIQFGGGPHFCLGYHVAWMESVQYAVALARHLAPKGLRPLHTGNYPALKYLPLLHPDPKTKVAVGKGPMVPLAAPVSQA